MKTVICVLLAALVGIAGCGKPLSGQSVETANPVPDQPPQKKTGIPVVTPVTDFTADLFYDTADALEDVAKAAGGVALVVGYVLASGPGLESGYHPQCGYRHY